MVCLVERLAERTLAMTDPADAASIEKVADGFYVRQAIDNTAWVDMGGVAIVVDALEQRKLAKEVFQAIADTIGDVPVKYLFNTHTHYDHVALNRAFKKRYGTEIVNTHTATIPPEGLWYEGERRRALMLPMPGCHTEEDCVVWLPADRALFVGDIFGWGLIPLTRGLNDETAQLLLDTHQRLIDFDPAVVIPGHGPLCRADELIRWVEYFCWLRDEVRRACREGMDDAQIVRDLTPPDDMKSWWRFLQWKHADSVAKVIKAVRHGWTDG